MVVSKVRLPSMPAHAPRPHPYTHLCVLRLRAALGPQALQHFQLPEVHICAGHSPAPTTGPQFPRQLHSCACQPVGKKKTPSEGTGLGIPGASLQSLGLVAHTGHGYRDRPS